MPTGIEVACTRLTDSDMVDSDMVDGASDMVDGAGTSP